MSDTVKLIIEIPRIEYEQTCNLTLHNRTFYDEAIRKGVLLDDAKAEIEKLDEGITSYHNDNPWVYKSEVLQILDNIGKESETN